jgi:hypothetical protein
VLIRGLKDVSGITEIYAKRQAGAAYRYEQVYSRIETQSAPFQSWAKKHSAELVSTMAGPSGPDLIGLLGDGFGFRPSRRSRRRAGTRSTNPNADSRPGGVGIAA